MPRFRRVSPPTSDDDYEWDERVRQVRHHRRPARPQDNTYVYAPRSYSTSRPVRGEPVYNIFHNEGLRPPSPPRRARSMSRGRPSEFVETLEDRVFNKNLDRLAAQLVGGRGRQSRSRSRSRSHHRRRSSSSSRDESEHRRQLRKLRQREQEYEDQIKALRRGKQREKELDDKMEELARNKQREKELEDRMEELARNKQRQRDYDDQLEDLKREKDRVRRHEAENEHGKRRDDIRRELENERKLDELRELHEKAAKKKYLEDALLAEKIATLEKEREDKAYEKKIREKLENERIKAELEELERVQRENKLKEEAIEQFKKEETEKEIQRREAKEKADEEFQERLKKYYGGNVPPVKNETPVLAIADRPYKDEAIWGKVHRQWVCPETLNAFQIPWEYSDDDADYLLINCFIDNDLQESLFKHTRDLREARRRKEQKMIAAPPAPAPAAPVVVEQPLLEMKINDRERDKMFLVKKKNERKGLSFFR